MPNPSEAQQANEQSKRLRKSNKFDDLCIRLHRNDPSITDVSGRFCFPDGYAQPLGQAMLQNTHVTSISIHIMGLLPPITEDFRPSAEEIAQYVNPLVRYMQTSKALGRVMLFTRHRVDEINDQLVELFLGACLHNVEALDIHFERFPVRHFQQCGEATKLKKLCIWFDRRPDFGGQDIQAMGDAFRFFPSLTNLYIETVNDSLLESILSGVHRGSCQLDELALLYEGGEPSLEIWSGIREIVYAPSTQFKHLHLDGFDLSSTEAMEEMIRVFKRPDQPSWGSSVSELTLEDCSFGRSSKRLLLDFMRTRVEQPNTELGVASLKKLDIEIHHDDGSDLSSSFLVKILCTEAPIDMEQKSYLTIGSQIESLSLSQLSSTFPRFLDRLAEHSSRICLKELVMSTLDKRRHAHALARCIAKISSLRTLKVYDMRTSARPMLAALRENGTLRSVSIVSTVASEVTSRLALAYSERNQFLEPLLLEATENSEQTEGEVARLDDGPTEPSKRHLCLTFLQTATQIPNTQSASVMRSLIRLDESIGLP